MFAKLVVLFSTLTAVAVAQGIAQCDTGSTYCCTNVFAPNSSQAATVLGNIVGANVGQIAGLIGVGCTTVAVIGGAVGTNCAQQPVCCQGTQFNGLINVGCTPISA